MITAGEARLFSFTVQCKPFTFMISIRHNFLFIHVPKTGGNSIQSVLRDYSEDEIICNNPSQDGIERFGVKNTKHKSLTKHSPLSHYKSAISPDIYKSLFKFSVIRNPWDMLISYYFSPHRGIATWSRIDFLALLKNIPTWRQFISETPQDTQKRLGYGLDLLLRFESLDDDFKLACTKIGIPYSPLPHRNKSVRSKYSVYYDQELVEAVRVKFQDEINLGEYHFPTRR